MCKNKTSAWWGWFFFLEAHSCPPSVLLPSHTPAVAADTQVLALILCFWGGGGKGHLKFVPWLLKGSSWHRGCSGVVAGVCWPHLT